MNCARSFLKSDMFWLAADLLRHAAPTELKKLMQRRGFYKHFAPLELERGCASAEYFGSALAFHRFDFLFHTKV
jgi:hypothetical protein